MYRLSMYMHDAHYLLIPMCKYMYIVCIYYIYRCTHVYVCIPMTFFSYHIFEIHFCS